MSTWLPLKYQFSFCTLILYSQRGVRSVTGSTSSLAASAKSQCRESTDEESSQQKQKHKNLTDRLVFYPSSNNIADYNSSMNLDYMGYNNKDMFEKNRSPDHRNKAHAEQQYPGESSHDPKAYMRSTSVPNRSVYYAEYGSSTIDGSDEQNNRFMQSQSGYASMESQQIAMKQASQRQMAYQQPHTIQDRKESTSMGNHKYLNKFSQWLPDLKLKKTLSKRYRSHSLPAVGDSDDDSVIQQPSHAKILPSFLQDKRFYGKLKDASTSDAANSRAQTTKGDRSFLQRKSFSLSTSHTTDANGKKKKRTIASTMSNIMQKAKVYRRHSFSHSSLANEYQSKSPDNQRYYHQSSLRGVPSTSRFVVPKQSHQSQSDPESVYSDFLSDTDDKITSDAGDRSAEQDSFIAENLFPTMEQTMKYEKSPKVEQTDQGIQNK